MKTLPQQFENRIYANAQLRADGAGSELVLAGRAASYNVLSHDLGGFKERITPTAFARALRDRHDVRCLFNHDASRLLGRTTANTLVLSSDDKGLNFRCQLDPNQGWHRDLWSAVQRRDVSNCSFAFTVPDDDGDLWDQSEDEQGVRFSRRTLLDVDLGDVSVVTYPAYPSTEVDVRDSRGCLVSRARLMDAGELATMRKLAGHLGKVFAADEAREIGAARTSRPGPDKDQFFRAEAARLGDEIKTQLVQADRLEGPSYTWDFRECCYVPVKR